MQVETIAVGPLQANCFVVWAEAMEAIVIDPGADPDAIMTVLAKNDLGVALYALTHGHADHISALSDLCAKHAAPFAIHDDDLGYAFDESKQILPMIPCPQQPPTKRRSFVEGMTNEDGGMTYSILHTPGHTPGSVCLYFPSAGCLFTGDTLFDGSIGRTDFPGGDSQTMMSSLERLASLPDNTMIYPGHGPSSDIGTQKSTNYFLQSL